MIRSALFPTAMGCLRRSAVASHSLPTGGLLAIPSTAPLQSPVRFGHGKQLKKKKDPFSRLTQLHEIHWWTPLTPEEEAELPDIRKMSNLQWRKTDRNKDQQAWACIHQIFPDVLGKVTRPTINFLVDFDGELVFRGNWIKPAHLATKPKVAFEPEAHGVSPSDVKDTLWTVMMVDADFPTRDQPDGRSNQHWLVTNIPASGTISDGDTIVDYLRPIPYKDTGTHRYVILLYRQANGKTSFEDLPTIEASDPENRRVESVDDFAEKYDLNLHAYVFFQSKWDSTVTEYFESLGKEEPVWESQGEANERAMEEDSEIRRAERKVKRDLGIK